MTDPTSEYIHAQERALGAALAFIETVAGGAAWWDDVWEDHRVSLDVKRDAWVVYERAKLPESLRKAWESFRKGLEDKDP